MKKFVILLGFMVMALVTIPQSANAGACRPGEDGCITAKDIAFNAISSNRIVSVSGTKVTGSVANADNAANADALGGFDSSAFSKKYGNVIVVAKTGGDYDIIQDAIDSISPVDTPTLIKVMPGIYIEDDIQLVSNVHLQGLGSDVTTITSTESFTLVTFDNVSSVSISGFTLDSTWCSIESLSSSVKITDNTFTGGGWGIYNDNSSPIIDGNIFIAVEEGIENVNSTSALITNNIFKENYNCTRAIDSEDSTSTIKNNVIKDFGCYGIRHVNGSAIIMDNVIETSGNSVSVEGDGDDYVSGNLITGSTYYGLYYKDGSSPTIVNNKITGNAIDIKKCANCNLSFNTFSTIGAGVNACQSFNVKTDGTAWTCP